jgi:hypothetical protein
MEKATFRTLCLGLLLLSATSFSQSGNNINGQVKYHNNFPMSGVTAYLHNSSGEVISTTTTNNGGHYTFQNVAAGNYTLTFTTEETAGGVTLTDAFIVMLHLFNLYPFNSIQQLASDVNGSGTITWDDYFLILIGYLNQGDPFPIGPWVFEQFQVTMPAASREGFTTRGGSSGDVNGSLIPDPKNSSIFLSDPITSQTVSSSDPIDFTLSSNGNFIIAGMHLVIEIPEGLELIDVESSIPSASISKLNNEIRVTWIDDSREGFEIADGKSILVITTKQTSPTRDEKNYSLRLSNESHFIDVSGELISGVTLVLPTIHTNTIKDIAVAVYPNPFKDNTLLNYQIPEDGAVTISVFDQAGRQVQELKHSACLAGKHEVKIEGSDLVPGIYHYAVIYTGNHQLINTGTIIKSK